MPIISQFYGILIQIFFEKEGKHNLKHIHVRYNEYKACYDLDGNLIEGKLPTKQRKLVEAWVTIHREELYLLWECVQNEGEYFKIEPLK